MDVLKLLALIQQIAALGGTVAELVEAGRDALSSEDEAALKAGLADLEAKNSATYSRVRAKLDAAAKRG